KRNDTEVVDAFLNQWTKPILTPFHITIEPCHSRQAELLKKIQVTFPSLEALTFTGGRPNDIDFKNLVSICPRLKTLSLSVYGHISSKAFEEMALAKSIEEINLHATQIGDVGLSHIVSS